MALPVGPMVKPGDLRAVANKLVGVIDLRWHRGRRCRSSWS